MTSRLRLGFINPSSNTVFEPLSIAMLGAMPDVSLHYSRFPVIEISLSEDPLRQFDPSPMVAAAALLADAKIHGVAWHGTSGSWRGLHYETDVCGRLAAAARAPATTAVLALNEALRVNGVGRLGLVTPYLPTVQERIIANYQAIGVDCVAEAHMSLSDNYAFAEVSAHAIAEAIRRVAAARPDAIAIVCSNLQAAQLVEALEGETGILILDSIAVTIWATLRLVGVDPARVLGWGRLFAQR